MTAPDRGAKRHFTLASRESSTQDAIIVAGIDPSDPRGLRCGASASLGGGTIVLTDGGVTETFNAPLDPSLSACRHYGSFHRNLASLFRAQHRRCSYDTARAQFIISGAKLTSLVGDCKLGALTLAGQTGQPNATYTLIRASPVVGTPTSTSVTVQLGGNDAIDAAGLLAHFRFG